MLSLFWRVLRLTGHGNSNLPRRWLAFNGVGLLGVGVQLGLVALLAHGFGVSGLLATAIAVEVTVLHNFVWHQHWTWRDRPSATARDVAGRLVRFHLLNGAVSLSGNLAIVAVLGGTFAIDPVAANAVAIVVCSMINFAASEALVFKTYKRLTATPSPPSWRSRFRLAPLPRRTPTLRWRS